MTRTITVYLLNHIVLGDYKLIENFCTNVYRIRSFTKTHLKKFLSQ